MGFVNQLLLVGANPYPSFLKFKSYLFMLKSNKSQFSLFSPQFCFINSICLPRSSKFLLFNCAIKHIKYNPLPFHYASWLIGLIIWETPMVEYYNPLL